ncbi:MAG: hypothetical protein K8F30_05895 [Taibaiella sp.]|nr:hypothetical protein [Taibaiella sp.]
MKHVVLYLIFLTITAISFSACRQHEDCPAFDETLFNDWFPYETGVDYSFVSSDGIREVLVIDEKDFTKAYSIDHGAKPTYTAKCDVHGEMRALTDKDKPDEIGMRLQQSQVFAGMKSDYVVLEFRGSKQILLNATENTLGGRHERGSTQFSTQEHHSLDVNGMTYNTVIQITITDESEAARCGLKDIYIAKGQGILGYRSFPGQREYWKEQ